jgi:DNA-binding NtrC family response regulator
MSSVVSESTVAESLRIVLVKKKLNISKLAEMLGVTPTTMYSKFNRNNFTLRDMTEISRVLNLNMNISFEIKDTEQ